MESWHWWWIAGILLVTVVATRLGHRYLTRLAEAAAHNTRPVLEAVWRAMAHALKFSLACVALARILYVVPWPERLANGAHTLAAVADTVAVAYLAMALTNVAARWVEQAARRTRSRMDDMLAPLVGKTLRGVVWVLAMVQIVQTLSNRPITSILAGLGIGGLAVALAAQETIRNFFGSLVLLMDKPFEIGDRIRAGDLDGEVIAVGFRSTRIRTLDGERVTIPNADLASRVIYNVGQRSYIRRVLTLGIAYETPPERVRRALEILREMLNNHEGMDPAYPPRIHFTEFAPYSLNLEVVFWYHPADWWKCRAFVERLNLRILEQFNREGIVFAYPTQTVYVNPPHPA